MEITATAVQIILHANTTDEEIIYCKPITGIAYDSTQTLTIYNCKTGFPHMTKIKYSEITKYNGGAVPAWADFLTAIKGFLTTAHT